ncbi:hypothetical protein ACVDFE_00265 [Lentzea chajnantorensis]
MSAPGKASKNENQEFAAAVFGSGVCLIVLLLIAAVTTGWFGKGAGQTVATVALFVAPAVLAVLYARARGGRP